MLLSKHGPCGEQGVHGSGVMGTRACLGKRAICNPTRMFSSLEHDKSLVLEQVKLVNISLLFGGPALVVANGLPRLQQL